MPNTINPSMYLPNDPEKINFLKPDPIPQRIRIIDHATLKELNEITRRILEVMKEMAYSSANLKKLADQNEALAAIIWEGIRGLS